MLNVVTSNRLETLAEELGAVICQPLGGVFEPESILVQSKGMERWLNLELASLNGISANLKFPFPKSFVVEVLRRTVGLPEVDPFSRESMIWRVMGMLPELLDTEGFELLKGYVDGLKPELRLFQLSTKIADLMDGYQIYRPNMMSHWTYGEVLDKSLDPIYPLPENMAWQKVVWNRLCEGEDDSHFVGLLRRFLAKDKWPNLQLPKRFALFGFSNLPPVLLKVFEFLGRFTDVTLYYLTPCSEFWHDCISEKKFLRLEEDGCWEVGNPLLMSLGTLGQDFARQVVSLNYTASEAECFVSQGRANLLENLQDDILHLVERGQEESRGTKGDSFLPGFGNDETGKVTIAEGDNSFRLHCCHSPMREVEVLYDQLLDLLASDPDLQPKDIIVMAPDIQLYAPYVQAVFDAPEQAAQRLPYTIADRSPEQESPVVQSFLNTLNLTHSRYTAAEVMDLCAYDCIYPQFGLSEQDLERIRFWIRETNIRWGINDRFREAQGLPRFAENSWHAGLRRLLLGYAISDEGGIWDGQIVPFDVEGDDARILGCFMDFTDTLFSFGQKLRQSSAHTVADWLLLLNELQSRFLCKTYNNAAEFRLINTALNSLEKATQAAAFDEPIALSVLMSHLNAAFTDDSAGFGFLQGGITFCRFLPMRSIPAKMVYLLGLNDGVFPRQNRSLGFDLAALHRLPCDRSPRNDDRYLFLESLISARRYLYLSYVGRQVKDNSEIPPSVLICELLDYLRRGFETASGEDPVPMLTIAHKLQPFHPDYFSPDGALFSFSSENCRAASALLGQKGSAPKHFKFISEDLVLPFGDARKEVSLDELIKFFDRPANWFLRNRLRISTYLEDELTLKDDEHFEISPGLESYKLADDLLQHYVEDPQWKGYQYLMAEGRLPLGDWGKNEFDELDVKVKNFAKKVTESCAGRLMPPRSWVFHCPESGWVLSGMMNSSYPAGQVYYRWADDKAKDRMKAWVRHLFINASGTSTKMIVVYDKKATKCKVLHPLPVEVAKQRLSELLMIFDLGTQSPLPFFPETSMEFVKWDMKGNSDALERAATKWEGSDWGTGEADDAAVKLCFGGQFPGFDNETEFIETATTVCRPIIEAWE